MHSKRFFVTFFLILQIIAADAGFAQVIKSIRRASLSPGTNTSGKNTSYDPEIDGSGRYVVFTSLADNFAAPGAVKGRFHEHGYLRDMLTGITIQLDVTPEGRSASPAANSTPNFRAFTSSIAPVISRDGTHLAFVSPTTNITPDGSPNDIGNWIYLRDITSGEVRRVPPSSNTEEILEYPTNIAINADGSFIISETFFSVIGDKNCSKCRWELTFYEKATNTTVTLNTGLVGDKFNPDISDDGRYIVFENKPDGLNGTTYSYLYDRISGELQVLNDSRSASAPKISGDGNFIAYTDIARVPTMVKLRNRLSGEESWVSVGMGGEEPNGISDFPAINLDGRYIAFLSDASNLVPDDKNKLDDIFVFDRIKGTTTLVSVQSACPGVATKEDFNTGPPAITSDGKTITFAVLERLISSPVKENGKLLEPADRNKFDDVYVAEIDYDAEPALFSPELRPNKPLVTVNCTGSKARIEVGKLESNTQLDRVGSKKRKGENAVVKNVVQKVFISRTSGQNRGKVIKKLTAKRNVLAAANLPPGNYSARVKAEARLNNGKTSESKLSLPSNFTISK